jgi:dihydrodipicolinate synthase/N-acetylneuraminate lyase
MSHHKTEKNVPGAFRGMMPILPTTITESGAIDEASQRRLVRYCLQCNAAAIGHFGFASEFFKLSARQRDQVARIVIDETAGRAPVFLGVTGPSNQIALEYARQAEQLGADLLMVAIPYVAVPDKDGVYDYYREIAEATSLPIIVQDTPLSAATLTPEMIYRMCSELPNVRYVKAEGTDFLTKTARLMEIGKEKLHVIGGAGGRHMIHMLRLGVTSFMTGTEMLDLHAAVVQHFLTGDEESAAKLYFDRLLPYFVFYDMYPEELLKKMLHLRGIIDCPRIIPPRAGKPMSDVEWREFEWVLQRIRFSKFHWESGQVS